jgi:hypothetical protein
MATTTTAAEPARTALAVVRESRTRDSCVSSGTSARRSSAAAAIASAVTSATRFACAAAEGAVGLSVASMSAP